jgi:CRISPR-associated endonuclease Csn1
MKKILGLDLGTNSIGWALIEEGESILGNKIHGMGCRIVPLSPDDKNEFTTGNAISKNQKRTTARTQRKGYDRYQLRRKYLIEALRTHDMLPNETLKNIPKLDLWSLRSKAVNQKISLQELGRVLLHMNQKRGYKSSRSDANLDKKDTEYVVAVKSRYDLIKDHHLTIGQYFYQKLNADEYYRLKEQVFPREAYIDEFDSILKEQAKHYPTVLISEFVHEIRNEIIYYQRSLKSQKGLVSVCDFEGYWTTSKDNKEHFVGPKVAPKSSPLFQVCKIWENINNIALKDKIGNKIEIIPDKKAELFTYLDSNERLTFSKLLEILGLKRDEVYGNKQLNNGLTGNTTKCQILKCFNEPEKFNHLFEFQISITNLPKETYIVDKDTGEIIQTKPGRITEPNIENQPFYKLWHVIYSIHDKEDCIKTLISKFGIEEEIAQKLASIDFTKQAFGNKSVKAMRKILPYLMEGDGYSMACEYAGYNHSNTITKDENLKRKLLDKLKPIEKNSLRQPVVEKILNQMVNLVNAIIEKYGKPDEIRVELARELKQSKEERNDSDRAMRKRERENQLITENLKEFGLRATRNNILKWRLYHEINNEEKKFNACCIYCGQPISLTSAIKGDEVDIEHIIPQSRLFDDSQNNKTLAHRRCNATKGNDTAFDFMNKKSKAEFDAYIERVNLLYHNFLISKSKRDKLLTPGDKIPTDFIDRQLRQTQYIARKSREILQTICRDVWATSGTVTAELRHIWGWDDVLMNLQIPKYRDLGLTETEEFEHKGQKHVREKIVGWTKRDDHRHHAIDALTIACTKQGFIQRLNTLNSDKNRDAMYKAVKEFQLANESNFQQKQILAESTIVAYEEEKRKLFEEYLYSQRPFDVRTVENHAAQILLSFKAGKKVASKGIRKIKQNGKKVVIQNTGIIVPRGALSEQSVYGKIKSTEKKPVKYLFENPQLIFKPRIKKLVEDRLSHFDNDKKKATASLAKEPIYVHKGIELTFGTCFKEEYVIKYPIETIKAKDIDSIIDKQVRVIVKERLEKYGNKEKEAFKDLENNPVWFNEEKRIPIKTVRCFTGLASVEPVKKNENGEDIAFVKPGNNHHIAFYTDTNGKKQEHVCTFWHAVERKKYGLPAVIENPAKIWEYITQHSPNGFPQPFLEKLPDVSWNFEMSMQQNEMFVLGLQKEAVEAAIQNNEYELLSNHLYRVQKMSIKGNGQIDIWFRYQLETGLNDDLNARKANRFYNVQSVGALFQLNPVKVRINLLGEISKLNVK